MIHNPKSLTCWANRNIMKNCVEITVTSPGPLGIGPVAVGLPITMQKLDEDKYIEAPTLRLTSEEAQLLMNELWNCNVRPSDGTGNIGQVGAMQTNLIDLRAQLVEAWELIKSLQQMVDQLLGLKK